MSSSAKAIHELQLKLGTYSTYDTGSVLHNDRVESPELGSTDRSEEQTKILARGNRAKHGPAGKTRFDFSSHDGSRSNAAVQANRKGRRISQNRACRRGSKNRTRRCQYEREKERRNVVAA